MTFYNVISGILFVAACQACLSSLGTPRAWFAATLLFTILNEAASTSDLLENRRAGMPEVDYTFGMKLLDFTTFGILLWALLILTPSQNALQVDVSKSLWAVNDVGVFWLLLAAYWLLTYCWNHLGGQCDEKVWRRGYIWFTRIRFLPFLALAFAGWGSEFSTTPTWTGGTGFVLSIAFLLLKFAGRSKSAH